MNNLPILCENLLLQEQFCLLNEEQQDDSKLDGELDLSTDFCQIIESWVLEDEINWYDAGQVISVGDGIVMASGLEDVASSELVVLQDSMYGLALNLQNKNVGIILFGNDRLIGIGDTVARTERIVGIQVGTDGYLDRIVDSLSSEVLHSWAVPSFGVKVDACPGRLNQVSLFIYRLGIFYGQCSEICGINHGFMPIVIESLLVKKYSSWVFSFLNKTI